MRHGKLRELVVDGKVWQYLIGRSNARLVNPQGQGQVVRLDDLTGRTWDTLERGHWKGTSDCAITPQDVVTFLRGETIHWTPGYAPWRFRLERTQGQARVWPSGAPEEVWQLVLTREQLEWRTSVNSQKQWWIQQPDGRWTPKDWIRFVHEHIRLQRQFPAPFSRSKWGY